MPRRSLLPWRLVVALLIASDFVLVLLGLTFAYALRFHASWLIALEPRMSTISLLALVPLAVVWLGLFGAIGLYRKRNLVSGLSEYQRVWGSGALAVLAVIVFLYLETRPYVSRGFIFLSLVVVAFLVCLGRFLVRRLIYAAANRGWFLDRVLVVGTNRQAIAVAQQLSRNLSASSEVVGFLSEYLPIGAEVTNGLRVLGEPLQLEEVGARIGATSAVVLESGLSWESLQGLVRSLHGPGRPQVTLIPGMFDLHATPMEPHRLGPVMGLRPLPSRIVGQDAVFKRLLDVVVGSLATLIALPLMLLVAAVSFLSGRRIGLVRESYLLAGRQPLQVSRFTAPWARRSHLSRLPELFAVLIGRMSLVGPRPVSPGRAAEYGRAMALLASAKPGFIGPWWLVGMARPADVEDEIAYDLFYVRNYSIWLDTQILVQAARSLLARDRAKIAVYPVLSGVGEKERVGEKEGVGEKEVALTGGTGQDGGARRVLVDLPLELEGIALGPDE
jgi:lipopolysaccharide/colanic/teichoic acid biosynthesis glycosyltransferase